MWSDLITTTTPFVYLYQFSILVSFLIAVTKYLTRHNIKGEEFVIDHDLMVYSLP